MDEASITMYEAQPAVSALNKVPGFDPREFMRKTVLEHTRQEALYLDLKYKKLWFRLAYPKGRIKKTALKITEQIAIMEAKIYLDKNDAVPISSFIAQRHAGGRQGSLYIEAAQYAAENQALIDAGFGLQFCDISQGPDAEHFDDGIPVPAASLVMETSITVDEKQLGAVAGPLSAEQVVNKTEAEVETLQPQEVTPVQQAEPETATAASAILPGEPHAAIPATETVEEVPETLAFRQRDTALAPQIAVPETVAVEIQDTQATVETPSQSVPPEAAENADAGKPATQAVLEMITGGAQQTTDVEAPPLNLSYTADMPVDEILKQMTPDEAAAVIVDMGTCKGWTLAEVYEKRPASLKWYNNGYNGNNNILRAGAMIVLNNMAEKKAS